jgi:thymidylate synthase ThyX
VIEVKIIADSVNDYGNRITTMQLRYPRFIHSEFMTHRVFSRNARSSRAVPTKKLIEEVRTNPVMPVHWGQNQAGMQADTELPEFKRNLAIENWKKAALDAAIHATQLEILGVHKQVVNRILEPFLHIDVVVTATEWSNFYALRRHKDAQPEIKALADMMWESQQASKPEHVYEGEWHLPYITPEEWDQSIAWDRLIKISVARCARVSYKTFEGTPTKLEDDLKLYDRLVGAHPMHASPAEHQATPDPYIEQDVGGKLVPARPELWGNFKGWIQYRKTLRGENV